MKAHGDAPSTGNEEKERELCGLVYLRYFKKLYVYIWHRVGKSKEVAQDLVQDVFLNAFKHVGRLQQQSSSYLAYLFKIAKNLLVSHYRKQKPIPMDPLPEVPMEPMRAVEEMLDAKMLLSRADRLPPHYRDVLRMKYIEELPIRTIAQNLGKTENAVKLSLYRAKRALRNDVAKSERTGTTV